MEISWVKELDIPCTVPGENAASPDDMITLTLRQALLTTKTSSNWSYPLFLAIDRVLVEDEWRVYALYNNSLHTEAVTMATHIYILLQARFGNEAVDTWFLPEARDAAQGKAWDASLKQVVSINPSGPDDLDVPIYGASAQHQSWELLDDFDDFDDETADEPPLVFELDQHFSLRSSIDFASCRDTGSTKSFTTGATNATNNIAAQTEVAAVQAAANAQEGDSIRSDLTSSTLNTHASNRGTPPGISPPALRSALKCPARGAQKSTLPPSPDTVQQTPEGEGHD